MAKRLVIIGGDAPMGAVLDADMTIDGRLAVSAHHPRLQALRATR